MRAKKLAPKPRLNSIANSTYLFLNSLGGRVPMSPFQSWTPMKTMISRPNPTNNPMMRELLHAYSAPPHCRASSRQMTPGMKRAAPMMSSCLMRSRKERERVSSVLRLTWRKKKTMAMATPPMGRLM